jgi:hypothetical protein
MHLFERAFDGEAHHEYIYGLHFERTILDGARQRVPVLDQLLRLNGV